MQILFEPGKEERRRRRGEREREKIENVFET